ncbi:3-deoxy-D-manno-octulosonic acid transferase [Bradyrhizobium sp. WD16]|uniref:3-deoxy-D-manno-octulosonic acid transferase n=1 Tax=Bradyrhizobium sp. WD16 TaxID=1521768 RepID=UPI0020A2A700|nr:3-deoxy-D-manno-octulosonic acid transferase [Bradyrhizobium sp. WD16]UTD27674.1 3-deoxy-D-manno-octulosonic acid transferase [Bradyrhizobium sp. WD16]
MPSSAARTRPTVPVDLPLTLRAYRRLSAAAMPLSTLLIHRRIRQGKEETGRINERRGLPGVARPRGPLIWIHGASVGEVLAAAELIGRLRAHNIRILLTSGTVTSAGIVAKRFPSDVLHQYVPFDAPRYVSRFLDFWQPSLALFIESDLWPNLIISASSRRIPMVVINGRMSPRSYPRWRRALGTISALLGRFELCLAQSQLDAERFSALGAENVVVTGNLKLDVAAPPSDPAKFAQLRAAIGGRPVIAAASTHPGEEELIAAVHARLASQIPGLLSVIVPRHPKRGEAVARDLAAAGFAVARRAGGELPSRETEIYVADTMGELGLVYRLAPVVFMGGSLVPHGGQNPIEAIKLGAATLHGPHVFNFAEVYEALDQAGGAALVSDADDLALRIARLLGNEAARARMVAAGTEVVTRLGGALERTLAALEPYLLQLRIERGAIDA